MLKWFILFFIDISSINNELKALIMNWVIEKSSLSYTQCYFIVPNLCECLYFRHQTTMRYFFLKPYTVLKISTARPGHACLPYSFTITIYYNCSSYLSTIFIYRNRLPYNCSSYLSTTPVFNFFWSREINVKNLLSF